MAVRWRSLNGDQHAMDTLPGGYRPDSGSVTTLGATITHGRAVDRVRLIRLIRLIRLVRLVRLRDCMGVTT